MNPDNPPRAHIISIGNELLIGDTVNSNASWIGRFLTEQGFLVDEVRTISDDFNLIKQAVQQAMDRAGLVIMTGGLGPTHDDITKKAVSDLFQTDLKSDSRVLEHIQRIFEKRGLKMTSSNRDQALVPEGSEILFNSQGTAPGIWMERNSSALAILPGVPYEMRHLMNTEVEKMIRRRFPGRNYKAVHYLQTAGIAESTLSDTVIGNLDEFIENENGIAFLPDTSGVTIRVSAAAASTEKAEQFLEPLLNVIYSKAGPYIYGDGRDLKLAEVVGELLRERELTLSAAESCTGGLLCSRLTDIPGSSDYFPGGEVAYADSVKIQHLGVSEKTLSTDGAVSLNTALELAEGAAKRFHSEIGVSTTGIAGPGGGSDEKPVGTVWMGFRFPDAHFALKAVFTNERLINKERTVMVVLETVRRHLLQIDSYPYDLKPHYR